MSVQVHSTEANAALALYPVYPPQWITPVLPAGTADGGLPLSAFTPSGVELVIDPITGLQNWVMAVYDVVTIFVNGVSTGISKTIYPGEEQERILLLVPAIWFTNGVNDVRYRVTRASGNDADSPTLKLLYNNPAPTVTVSHPASVAPGQTAVITITVGYPRPHDTVTLTIGTWSITFPNPTSPINHTLTAAELQLIGDGTHSVFAAVRDQLTNNSKSAKTPITITANQKVYNAPIIAEAVDGMLDVAALKGQDATLRARDWTGIQVGQQVWLKFTGQKPDGSAHVLQFWNGDTHKVNATWVSQRFWDKPLLIAFLKALKDGSLLKLEFRVSEDKSNDFNTATKFVDQIYTIKARQPLSIDTTPMNLSGKNITVIYEGRPYAPPYRDLANTSDNRVVSGGVAPYGFRSSNETVATVDSTGTVRSINNGTATITITDQNNSQVSFQVIVTNAARLLLSTQKFTTSEAANAWINSSGGTQVTPQNIAPYVDLLRQKYPFEARYFCSGITGLSNRPNGYNVFINLENAFQQIPRIHWYFHEWYPQAGAPPGDRAICFSSTGGSLDHRSMPGEPHRLLDTGIAAIARP